MRRMICRHSFSALLVTEQVLRRKTLAFSADWVISQSRIRNSPTIAEVSALLSLHPSVCAAIRIIWAKNVIFKGFVPKVGYIFLFILLKQNMGIETRTFLEDLYKNSGISL